MREGRARLWHLHRSAQSNGPSALSAKDTGVASGRLAQSNGWIDSGALTSDHGARLRLRLQKRIRRPTRNVSASCSAV